MFALLKKKLTSRRGASATEYGLLVGLVAVTLLVAVGHTGASIEALFCRVSNEMAQIVGASIPCETLPADPLVANADSVTGGTVGTALTVTTTDARLLSNDTGGTGAKTITAVTAVSSGSVASTAGGWTLTPAATTSIFSYTIQDTAGQTATATVTVSASFGLVAVADSLTGHGGTALTLSATDTRLLANDTGAVSSLGITSIDGAVGGTLTGTGPWTFTPTQGADPVQFTYHVQDGVGGTASAVATVTLSNATPVAAADSVSYIKGAVSTVTVPVATLLSNDTDGDSDTLSVTSPTPVGGNVTFTLAAGDATSAAFSQDFSYTVSDGHGGTATGTLTANATIAASCKALQTAGVSADGIYVIGASTATAFRAYCNMTLSGGGWTLVAAMYENSTPTSWGTGVPVVSAAQTVPVLDSYINGSWTNPGPLLDYSIKTTNYEPSPTSGNGFTLSESQLPSDRTTTGFGLNANPVAAGYATFTYTTGDIPVTTVVNLGKTSDNTYKIHRHKNSFYGSHDPDGALYYVSGTVLCLTGGDCPSSSNIEWRRWLDTLTFDQSPLLSSYSWAFSRTHNAPVSRGYSYSGDRQTISDPSTAWTVWVR